MARAPQAEICADYSGRRPNCNVAHRRPAADLAGATRAG